MDQTTPQDVYHKLLRRTPQTYVLNMELLDHQQKAREYSARHVELSLVSNLWQLSVLRLIIGGSGKLYLFLTEE